MIKIFGTRSSLIGDTIMSLPILDYLKESVGEYYLYFSIAQKCKQSTELYFKHPLINQIKITDGIETLGDADREIISQCNIVFDVSPPHPKEQDWYNYRNCVEETILMAGLDYSKFTNKKPKLYRYWARQTNSHPTVAIWPFAGYGRDPHRSPSALQWTNIIKIIAKTHKVLHFGAEVEPVLSDSDNYTKLTNLPFFSQIKETLNCNSCIGTDSGSMWCIAAYNEIPQLNLITNHAHNHHSNHLALAPIGDLSTNALSTGGFEKLNNDLIISFLDQV